MNVTPKRPSIWFWGIAVVLLFWNLIGAYACIQQFRLGAEALGAATDYDRALYAGLPPWYDWVFAAAEITGVGGALALLWRRGAALPMFLASLAFVIVQFGYLFATTDIVAAKGASTTYFPSVIVAMCLFQIWLARTAQRNGWLAAGRFRA